MTRRTDWLSVLAKKVKVVTEETEKTRVEVKRKRASRKKKARSKSPDFSTPLSPCRKMSLGEAAKTDKIKAGQTQGSRVNWYHVQEWFIEGILRNNKDWLVVQPDDKWNNKTQTLWAWAEKNCAERLLKHYGEEIVRKTVLWFCDNWQGIKDQSRGKFGGAPSVKLLWTVRDRYFVEAKEGKVYELLKRRKIKKKRHMVGEYADSDMPRVGWGDDDEV